MSILIKGLNMPKITGAFFQEKFVLLICPETGKAEFNDGKNWVDYEMLEVKTPHGRLIDADETMKDIIGKVDLVRAFCIEELNEIGQADLVRAFCIEELNEVVDRIEEFTRYELNKTPTIIEAEEG